MCLMESEGYKVSGAEVSHAEDQEFGSLSNVTIIFSLIFYLFLIPIIN